MTGLTHVAVGATVGKYIQNPFLAFFAGILSHFIVDKVPHYWPDDARGQDVVMYLDGFLSVGLFVVFALSTTENHLSVLAGAFGGAIVDLVFVMLPKFWKKFYNNPVRVWHEKRQYHFHNPLWLATDFFLLVLSLGIIYL